jgi:hypothetical protein
METDVTALQMLSEAEHKAEWPCVVSNIGAVDDDAADDDE